MNVGFIDFINLFIYYIMSARDHPFMTSTTMVGRPKWTGVDGEGVMSSMVVYTVHTKIYF